MVQVRGWAVLAAAGVLLFGLDGTAAAQGRPGCGPGGGRGPMTNQMVGGMGQSQMSRSFQGGMQQMVGGPQMQQQMMVRQQLLALQLQQMQADAMGDDLMASLLAADLRRYQDRMRQIQKAQQQQLIGGR